MSEAECKARRKTLVTQFLAGLLVLVLAVLVGIGLYKRVSQSDEKSASAQAIPRKTPVEFLLLDTNRIDSYLAQLTEGNETNKKLGKKLAKSAVAGIDKVVKVQGELKEENFVEREVTPTAASRLLKLENELEKRNLVEKETLLRDFPNSIDPKPDSKYQAGKLEEGDMVKFNAVIHAPRYLEPYLAVNHEATVPALFPEAIRDHARRKTIETRRKAARQFRKQVGQDPRLILAIHPKQKKSLRRNITVLLPVHMKQLSEERSLLRTGGFFTIVGKVVRIFSPNQKAIRKRNRENAYVDLTTLHTWLYPVKNATRELICRSNLGCSTSIEVSEGATGNSRRDVIEAARRSMIRALRRGVRIEKTGGMLVIPIAIYR